MTERIRQALPLAALAATVALLAAGCGGGGGDTPVAPTRPPEEVEPPAVASVPAPVYADARRAGAFKRFNEVRAAAGLGLLAQSSFIDAAAQAHSKYIIDNAIVVSHEETEGKPGFTGESHALRMTHAGYPDVRDSTEVIAAMQISGTAPSTAGANLIDSLMGTPYHRNGMLRPAYGEVGIGLVAGESRAVLTVNLGRTASTTQGAPSTVVSIWPPADSTDIPTTMHSETPDPIPENNGAPAGYPASVKVNGKFRAIDVTSFEIRDSSGRLVDTKLLSYETDSILRGYFGDHSFAAALPRAPLSKNSRYAVRFIGSIRLESDGSKTPFTKSWSFTTGDKIWY